MDTVKSIVQVDIFKDTKEIRIMYSDGTWEQNPCGEVIIHSENMPYFQRAKWKFPLTLNKKKKPSITKTELIDNV